MTLISGTRLGPYEILAPLGAGGMGEVYRARDSKLKRDVAIKVLPQSLAADPDALERFEREALAVAALSHPNILSIFDFGKHDGISYAVMELLEGETLRRKLHTGPISQQQAVDYAVQAAKGLSAAHEKNIVHRDLKPENLFVSKDGHLKILDFGLAKQIEAVAPSEMTSAPTTYTRPGVVLGTMGYMSPEQVRGRGVDHRSDIFSFGAILYEMLTGQTAFRKETESDTMAAVMRDDPPEMSSSGRSIPASVDSVVRHCLEKDPANRFQTAKEIVSALTQASGPNVWTAPRAADSASGPRRGVIAIVAVSLAFLLVVAAFSILKARGPGGATPTLDTAPREPSIAVLPFVNLSAEKDKEYFSDGISEDLSNLLARIPELQVTARTSAFSFKGKEVAIPEIARQLHVAHVLEGSVRMSGNQMRITAQLIDAATDKQLWSETYDRKLDDVFAIQDEIAADVVKQLKVEILGAAPRARHTDPEAYALYLQAVQLTKKRSAEAFAQGDALLARVLEIDPRYVPAWAQVAGNAINEVTIGMVPKEQGHPRAHEAATKALAIDPDYARAHASLGSLAIFQGDIPAAARHFERALALDPADLVVLGNSSAVLKGLGRLNDAIALDEAVVRRDPVNTSWLFNLASAQNWAGRYDDAIGSLHAVLTLNPGFAGSHLVLGEALLGKGDAAGALVEIEQETHEAFRMIGLPMAYHALGREADSDAALAALIEKWGKDAPYDVAYVHAFRGEADSAFEWLDKSAAAKDPSLVLLLVENLFDNIHSDPRWLPFLRKLGKAPEQLAGITFKVTMPGGAAGR